MVRGLEFILRVRVATKAGEGPTRILFGGTAPCPPL